MYNENAQKNLTREWTRDAVDVHIHSGPDVLHRPFDDEEVAIAARDAGMEAILIKNHDVSTARSAYLVNKRVDGIKVFGGIVLNWMVGGINPKAVESTLKLGGKEVWLPTFDAQHVKLTEAKKSGLKNKEGNILVEPGISILRNNELIDEVKEIVDMVREYNAVLGTCHISKKEISTLIQYTKKIGNVKVLITHPVYKYPDLDPQFVKELVGDGVYVEICAGNFFPTLGDITVKDAAKMIKTVGPENCVISSDSGAKFVPIAPEALRVFAEYLFKEDFSRDELYLMLAKNPKRILDL